ncbi:hypothetical protein WK78_27550 [Burkholderia cepacia]|nr:hypothetical protein WK78_27550 [Burkholderia cepacia]
MMLRDVYRPNVNLTRLAIFSRPSAQALMISNAFMSELTWLMGNGTKQLVLRAIPIPLWSMSIGLAQTARSTIAFGMVINLLSNSITRPLVLLMLLKSRVNCL